MITVDRGSVFRVWLPLLLGLYCLSFVFVHGPGIRDLTRWIGLAMSLLGLAGVIVARYTLCWSFSVAAKATELFSIRNSLPHFGQVRRLTRILSITVPIISGARQSGQPMFISRYGSLTSLRGAAIGVLKQKWPPFATRIALPLRSDL